MRRCPKCGGIMECILKYRKGRSYAKYICTNISCDECCIDYNAPRLIDGINAWDTSGTAEEVEHGSIR